MHYLNEDQAIVWTSAKRTMELMSGAPLKIDEAAQALRANVEGAAVTVQVQIFDVDQTKLSVGAKKWGMYDAELANDVITRIKRDLGR